MKNRLFCVALVVTTSLAAPALAQSRSDQLRWEEAQRRYSEETSIYNRERDRYMSRARRDGRGYDDRRYGYSGARGYDDPYVTDYDAARYYRDDARYRERRLTAEDEVYRGSDGRYYCKRSDGTTGLIVGGAGGAILGNLIDGGRNRTAGTLIGGALGALTGRAIDQNSDVRCR